MKLHLGYQTGCIGRIAELHASYYSACFGFGLPFEAKVASELAQFCLQYTDGRDGLWLAIEGNVIHGSVAIDGSCFGDTGAHLRWFITSSEARGQGVGSRLLGAALDFCQERHNGKAYLWTFDELHAARRLYERYGFKLERTQRGAQWGKEVNEQLFARGEG